jgi:hypothetical protein
LKPAPPVYDPKKVARAVVSVINDPKSTTIVGVAPVFLKLAYLLFPALTRSITASVIRTYLKRANVIQPTSGNILQTVPYGTSVEGGWRKPVSGNTKAGLIAAGVAGLFIGALLFNKRSS